MRAFDNSLIISSIISLKEGVQLLLLLLTQLNAVHQQDSEGMTPVMLVTKSNYDELLDRIVKLQPKLDIKVQSNLRDSEKYWEISIFVFGSVTSL